MMENLILLLTPIVGVSCVAAFVFWQNERDAALRKARATHKKK
ncbi:hypothetical protein J2T09_002036 [Neorhizobium huautlense]|uniref:Uncharacterized protein n=1 Tax=Neorhizobium huautlense TaxID=67774 RepID=A0ABT9PS57_9HYPH|nr:hypothetical protein [Neorhizobium huautlense]MDP9837284.1 hypothetical protein [Neorhizobium huautlense]